MKKFAAFLLVTFAVFTFAFASGTPEEQRQFLESLPGFMQQMGTGTGVTTTISTDGDTTAAAAVARNTAVIERDMATLTRLYKYLDQNYLWDIDYNNVYEAMATAMFNALGDKYTYYVKAEDSDEYLEDVSGKYGGLGFYFSKTYEEYQNPDDPTTLYCLISQVFPNTPASRAGMAAGDLITHINGESTADLSSNQCASIMKGDVGEEVTLTVKRGSSSFDLTMAREIISVPTVEYTMLENKVGYLYIIQFYSDTNQAVKKALEDLQAQGMKKLIIDLRNCPGGDVDACLSIADMFISSSKLLTIKYKDPSKTMTKWASAATSVDPSVKVAILINGGSASSAEIFASTMRDNGRAVLIGQKSYGKGIMQKISMWDNADTSITFASFIPPSGKEIHGFGVEPDYPTDPVNVEEDQIDAYVELYNSGSIEKFVDENPDYSKKNVSKFIKENPDTGVSDAIVQVMLRNEYYSRMQYEERPKADTWYDPDITKALEVLKK